MKESNPFRLLSEVLPDGIKFLSEHPDRGAGVAATKSQLGQHVLLLGESLGRAAVIYDVQSRLPLENLEEGAEAVMQSFTRVDDINLGVGPDPWKVLIRLVVLYCGAEDDNVAEDPAVGALEKVQDKHCFPAARLPTDNRRMGFSW